MLSFVGLGISGFESIPIEGLEAISKADIVYLEQFTSPIGKSDVDKIQNTIKGEFIPAKRWLVEDGKEILEKSKEKDVVLLAYGDPYIATTHIELRTRAIELKIETHSIHASSSLTYPYYVIYKNIIEGNHTVLLLEYNQNKDFFLDPKDALKGLLETEKGQGRKVLTESSYAIVASRIGFKDQTIISGKISSLEQTDFGKPPHTVIIPGRLHFTESDALRLFGQCIDEPFDNSEKTEKISKQMMEKYVPMVREALEEIIPYYKNQKEFEVILDNAERYIDQAEIFLGEGRDENAILSIGYADGLVDALRLAKGLEFKM